MKPAFSLLELIFAIVVLGIIVSVAVPKFLDTRDSALVSTIKRDVNTVINSIQSYYLHISEYSDRNAGVQPDTFAMRFSRV